MRALLDTNALIWAATDDSRLSPAAKAAIQSASTKLFLSPVTPFELGVKIGLKKLKVPQPLRLFIHTQMQHLQLTAMPLEIAHGIRVGDLPLLHRDPFDRLLIAQALAESVAVITSDRVFVDYGVKVIW